MHPVSTPYDLSFVEVSDPARRVLDACVAAGGHPILVGGCVRDAIWSRMTGEPVASKDIDIEVYHVTGDDLWNHLSALDGVHLDMDSSPWGVYKVILDGEDFDVTLPRKDSKTGFGHTGFSVDVNPHLSYREAFARRDFTVNSMGCDPQTGELIDPFGGHLDLEMRTLRHTSESFEEDPVRVLRAVQFVGRFGFDLAPETAQKGRELVHTFYELRHGNVWKQFYALASKGRYISKALDALHETGWDVHFPTYAAARDTPQDPRWHPEGSVGVHLGLAGDAAVQIAERDGLEGHDRAALILAAITHDFGKVTHTVVEADGSITSFGHAEAGVEPVRDFLRQIGAPASYEDRILPLVDRHMCHSPMGDGAPPSDTAVRRLIRRLDHEGGGPSLLEWSRLVEADKAGRGVGALKGDVSNAHHWLEIAERLGGEERLNQTLLMGRDLLAEGFRPGPLFQFIIRLSRDAQDEGLFEDEAGALEWFRINRAEVLEEAESLRSVWEVEQERIKKERDEALREKNRLEKIARRKAKELALNS